MNHFLYIIPKTPANLQNDIRKKLWHLCVTSLINQTYTNWTALIIGENALENISDNRFISVDYEGRKEEKLQKATEYIITNNIPGDYIIRLDDDDIINPNILAKVATLNFDLYVDKYQWFWHYESGKVSNKVWGWFPNTCIHKREHALVPWGDYAHGTFKQFKEQSLLIENDHSKLHPYYKNKNVQLANKNHPTHIRTITNTSITAKNATTYNSYLKSFGVWRKNKLQDFIFLNEENSKINRKLPKRTIKEWMVNILLDLRNKQDYSKNISKENL